MRKGGTWTLDCVIRCRTCRSRADTGCTRGQDALCGHPTGFHIGSAKINIGSTNMEEDHFCKPRRRNCISSPRAWFATQSHPNSRLRFGQAGLPERCGK